MKVSKLFDLSGKVALITGGSRGLGLQMAEGARDTLAARPTRLYGKPDLRWKRISHGVEATVPSLSRVPANGRQVANGSRSSANGRMGLRQVHQYVIPTMIRSGT
jgi:hypothetical protein